jgi:hypothetical protein
VQATNLYVGDENGLSPNETTVTLPPAPIKAAQQAEVAFVKKWVKGWCSYFLQIVPSLMFRAEYWL